MPPLTVSVELLFTSHLLFCCFLMCEIVIWCIEQADRMAAAKSEAESLVSQYKSELEGTHQDAVKSQTGSSDSAAATLEGQRDAQIKEMSSAFSSKKDGVENMLAGFVTKVNTEPPKARSQLA